MSPDSLSEFFKLEEQDHCQCAMGKKRMLDLRRHELKSPFPCLQLDSLSIIVHLSHSFTLCPGMATHACNASREVAEMGKRRLQRPLGLHGEIIPQTIRSRV